MKCETGAKNFKNISQAHLRARDAFKQQLLPLPFLLLQFLVNEKGGSDHILKTDLEYLYFAYDYPVN